MKRSIVLATLLLSGLLAGAQSPTSAAPNAAAVTKVAVISFQQAVVYTNEFQRDQADLDKKFAPRGEEIKQLAAEIDSASKDLQAQGAKLAEPERARRQKAIEEKQKRAQRLNEDAQNDYQQEMQQIFGRVAAKFVKTLEQYAKSNGVTLIVDSSQSSGQLPIVLWNDAGSEISKVVVEAYNAQSGVPAPVK